MTEAIENTENYMEEITAPTVQKLPLLAMRGIVLFPNMIMHSIWLGNRLSRH